jgi:phage-related minor tail protein
VASSGLPRRRPALADRIDSTLSSRLRRIVAEGRLTESELRELTTRADGWARALRAQIRASERRIRRLTTDAATGVAEVADELRRLDELKPQLADMEALLADLETKARELRTAWLLDQAHSARR